MSIERIRAALAALDGPKKAGTNMAVNAEYMQACNPAAIRELLAERDALKADAERYRWLREHVSDGRCTEKDGYGGYTLRFGESLDAAIDAAKGQA